MLRGEKHPRLVDDDDDGMEDVIEERHTGLSPHLTKLAVLPQFSPMMPTTFFLEDGIETFSVDGSEEDEDRQLAVRELLQALDMRVERAAREFFGLEFHNSVELHTWKQKLAHRAAELEQVVFLQQPGGENYEQCIHRIAQLISQASGQDMRDILERNIMEILPNVDKLLLLAL